MSLVSYDYSDSEGEDSNEEVSESFTKVNTTSFSELFSSLPKPKKVVITPEEDLDNIPRKDFTEIGSSKQSKGTVKISIPALKHYDSDEGEPAKKIPKPSVKASGLFAVLPAPKCSTANIQALFDPKVIKSKNLIPRAVKAQAAKPVVKKLVESDDSDTEGEHFFSSIFTNQKLETNTSSVLNMLVDSAAPVKDMSGKSNQYFADLLVKQTAKPESEVVEPVEDTDEITDEKAIRQLCGKSRQHKKDQDIQFIDINADQIMPDSREWRTKALTEEKPSTAAGKKGEEPSHQSRRKHQITYLAYQAKMNEQELQNQWASNRISRKQTQAKYGF